jgi:hypothetical protein
MRKLLFILFFLAMAGSSSASVVAIYDSSAGTWDTTTYETASAALTGFDFEADDILELRADIPGGSAAFTEMVTINAVDAGTAGHPMIFRGRTGDTITIDGTGNDYCITGETGLSYVTVSNLTLSGAALRLIWLDGAGAEIAVSNIAGSGKGIWIRAKSSSTYDDISISNSSDYGFALTNTSTDVTVSDITAIGCVGNGPYGAIQIEDMTGLTASNLMASGTTGGVAIAFKEIAGAISISNVTATDNSDTVSGVGSIYFTTIAVPINGSNITSTGEGSYSGVRFDMCSGGGVIDGMTISGSGTQGLDTRTSTITIRNLVTSNNGNSGVNHAVSGTLTLYDPMSLSNKYDGFSVNDVGILTIYRGLAQLNGTVGNVNSGDGYTAHATSTLNMYNCIADRNLNSAIAIINSPVGEAVNCTLKQNGSGAFTRGGFWSQNTGGAGFNLKNVIFEDNYPYEINVTAAAAALYTATYSRYYHPDDTDQFTLDGGTTSIAWTAYDTARSETGSSYGDPLTNSDWTLQNDSPCLAAGLYTAGFHDTGDGQNDYAGQPVPPYDVPIGARTRIRPTGGVLLGGSW